MKKSNKKTPFHFYLSGSNKMQFLWLVSGVSILLLLFTVWGVNSYLETKKSVYTIVNSEVNHINTNFSDLFLHRFLGTYIGSLNARSLSSVSIKIKKGPQEIVSIGSKSLFSVSDRQEIVREISGEVYEVQYNYGFSGFLLLAALVSIFFVLALKWFINYVSKENELQVKLIDLQLNTLLESLNRFEEVGNTNLFTEYNVDEFNKIAELSNKWRVKLLEYRADMIEMGRVKAYAELARQVAHDIRSPVSALNILTSKGEFSTEGGRALLKGTIQRINEIAEVLLKKSKLDSFDTDQGENVLTAEISNADKTKSERLHDIIKLVIEEKKVQYSMFADIHFNTSLGISNYKFESTLAIELKRVISNLIDNAVEALPGFSGQILIRIESDELFTKILVSDNGVGILPEVLEKLGNKGFSYRKEHKSSGNGLGLYHAKKTMEQVKGFLEIKSQVGQGTVVSLIIPKGSVKN